MDTNKLLKKLQDVLSDDDGQYDLAPLGLCEEAAAAITRLTAEKEAAVRERDELREACREALITLRMSTLGRIATGLVEQLEAALTARPSSEVGGG